VLDEGTDLPLGRGNFEGAAPPSMCGGDAAFCQISLLCIQVGVAAY